MSFFEPRKTRSRRRDIRAEVRRHLPGAGGMLSRVLRKEKADKVFIGEHELAVGMTRDVLERVAAKRAEQEAAASRH